MGIFCDNLDPNSVHNTRFQQNEMTYHIETETIHNLSQIHDRKTKYYIVINNMRLTTYYYFSVAFLPLKLFFTVSHVQNKTIHSKGNCKILILQAHYRNRFIIHLFRLQVCCFNTVEYIVVCM